MDAYSTVTVGRVITTNVSETSIPAFVRSHSQSQARLMFVTTLELDNFDWTDINARFKACLREGLIHKWKDTLVAPPFPYVGIQFTALFHTPPLLTSFVYSIAAPTINCVF